MNITEIENRLSQTKYKNTLPYTKALAAIDTTILSPKSLETLEYFFNNVAINRDPSHVSIEGGDIVVSFISKNHENFLRLRLKQNETVEYQRRYLILADGLSYNSTYREAIETGVKHRLDISNLFKELSWIER